MYTFHDLSKWTHSEFEKLGWMVLAKEHGDAYKIAHYKKSLDHLLKALEHLNSEYSDQDKKHDLMVMWHKVKTLKAFVNKKF